MPIDEIARAVAAEWKMSFDGIELDFATEVAHSAVAAERSRLAERVRAEALFWQAEGQADTRDFEICALLIERSNAK